MGYLAASEYLKNTKLNESNEGNKLYSYCINKVNKFEHLPTLENLDAITSFIESVIEFNDDIQPVTLVAIKLSYDNVYLDVESCEVCDENQQPEGCLILTVNGLLKFFQLLCDDTIDFYLNDLYGIGHSQEELEEKFGYEEDIDDPILDMLDDKLISLNLLKMCLEDTTDDKYILMENYIDTLEADKIISKSDCERLKNAFNNENEEAVVEELLKMI